MFNIFNIFGTKQEKINWDKTAKTDYEGSISIETYSNNLTLDLRLSQTTLVCAIFIYKIRLYKLFLQIFL